MLSAVYEDSISLFEKTFDVPRLVFDILSRVKIPATCGKLYDCEVVSASRELFNIRFEFKTDEDTYFDVLFNICNSLERAEDFTGNLGCSLDNVESIIGNKYKLFYANMFNVMILGRINE